MDDIVGEFAFDEHGEFVSHPSWFDGGSRQNALALAMFYAKYDSSAREYIRFWLDAIEYDQAGSEEEVRDE